MADHGTTPGPTALRWVGGAAILIVIGWAGFRYVRPRDVLVEVVAPPGTVTVSPAPAPAAAGAGPAVAAAAIAGPSALPAVAPQGLAPSFDIVRVGPQGNAVIAGRAEPGAEVIVRDGATEVARTQADRQGGFVAIPAAPLATGGRELTLASRSPGGQEVAGDAAVLLEVPAAAVPVAPARNAARVPAGEPPAVVSPDAGPGSGSGSESGPAPVAAVLVPNAGVPRVLQEAAAGRPAAKPGVTLDSVDYDDSGAIRFTGGAAAGAPVRVYVDNGPAGDVRADAGGRWTLTPAEGVAAGLHKLRVDQIDAGGRVAGRVELPFQRVPVSLAELAGGRVVVQPGQNLWRLARLAYGKGVRYRVIYLANRDQIRDPRLIYPGQTFAVPAP